MCYHVLYGCVWGLGVICVHCMMGDSWCMHVCYTGVCEEFESYVYIAWWMRMCACVLHGCVWELGVICVHCMMDGDVCMCVIRVCVKTRSHMCTLYDEWGYVYVCYTGVCEDSESYVYIVWWMGMCACVLYRCVWGLGVICEHCMMDEDVCMCVIRVYGKTRSHMCTLHDGWGCVHVCYMGVCEDSESYVYITWWMRMCACVLYGCMGRLGVICVHYMMDGDMSMCVIRVCVKILSHTCTLHDGWGCVHVC